MTGKTMFIIKGFNSSVPDNLDLNSGSRGSFRPVWAIYQAGDQV